MTSILPLRQYLWPWSQRGLIRQFAVREVSTRYRGSYGGLTWAFVTPLLMLAVYTFVFQHIFHARWLNSDGDDFDFAIRLYAGLIVFNCFAEYLLRAPRLIVDQPNLVKRVVFPLEILPWAALFSALFHLITAALVLVLAVSVLHGAPQPALIAVPLVWAVMIPFLLGTGWFLSALGVYLKDLGQLIGLVVTFLQFLSPVFYPVEALPEALRPWLMINPLTLVIEETRRVTIEGIWPHWSALALYALIGIGWAGLGALFFRRVRKGFADVL
ncbi:MAG: ABC transporter permease [Betaproteobacteria bacterium]|nr:ABC transporter permease [Betaproteobacteria bacterium]